MGKNMASKLNTEFNYRYQVVGETTWEKIKTLKGFLEGRKRAVILEEVGRKKYEAKKFELENAIRNKALPNVILTIESEILELESFIPAQEEAYELNRQEIVILEKLLAELYAIAELTRIEGYSDEQMFEANAANEYTAMIAKDILSEIIASGRPSPAKIRNAMSHPATFNALRSIGLIPKDAPLLQCGDDPLKLEFKLEVPQLSGDKTYETCNPKLQ